jgi:protein TonB
MRVPRAEALRWSASFGVVLLIHLGGAAALLAWRVPHLPPLSVPAVLLDLAAPDTPMAAPVPDATSPAAAVARELPEPEPLEPSALTQPDRQAEALPPPEPTPEVVTAVPPAEPPMQPQPNRLAEALLPPEPTPEVVTAVPPPPRASAPPKPAPSKLETPRRPTAAAKSTPAVPAAQPAPAGTPSANVALPPSPDTLRRWQTALLAHLQRHKRYPGLARNNNEQGVVYLRFTMNRAGAIVAKAIERGSGHASLDTEALALIDRAQPLPAPPPDVAGERFEFVVPVQFQLR